MEADNELNARLAAARQRAGEAREAEAARWRRTPEQKEEARQRMEELDKRTHARHVAAGRRAAAARWAGHTPVPMTTCKLYPSDVRVLRDLKGYGFHAVGDVVHRLLALCEGLFWERCASPFDASGWSAYPLGTLFQRPSSESPASASKSVDAGDEGA